MPPRLDCLTGSGSEMTTLVNAMSEHGSLTYDGKSIASNKALYLLSMTAKQWNAKWVGPLSIIPVIACFPEPNAAEAGGEECRLQSVCKPVQHRRHQGVGTGLQKVTISSIDRWISAV